MAEDRQQDSDGGGRGETKHEEAMMPPLPRWSLVGNGLRGLQEGTAPGEVLVEKELFTRDVRVVTEKRGDLAFTGEVRGNEGTERL